MRSTRWKPCWIYTGSGLGFSDAVCFSSKYLLSCIVGASPSFAHGAVTGRGHDELQRRPVAAESAGGFRADPADRKRHVRRCVQGKKLRRGLRIPGFHYRTQVVWMWSCGIQAEQTENHEHKYFSWKDVLPEFAIPETAFKMLLQSPVPLSDTANAN